MLVITLLKDGPRFSRWNTLQLLIPYLSSAKFSCKYRYANVIKKSKIASKKLAETTSIKSPLPTYPLLFYRPMFVFAFLDFPSIIFYVVAPASSDCAHSECILCGCWEPRGRQRSVHLTASIFHCCWWHCSAVKLHENVFFKEDPNFTALLYHSDSTTVPDHYSNNL